MKKDAAAAAARAGGESFFELGFLFPFPFSPLLPQSDLFLFRLPDLASSFDSGNAFGPLSSDSEAGSDFEAKRLKKDERTFQPLFSVAHV